MIHLATFKRKLHGVTLLEILLVLSISAAIIISSIRYYESATFSLNANNSLEQIQAITAAIDHFSAGTSSYEGLTTPTLAALLPPRSLSTSWGTEITLSASDSLSYSIIFPAMPTKVCPLVINKLAANKHYQVTSTCSATTTDFTYTYLASA
jgi:type II secretory pathway pseudopilin PulG